MQAVTKTENIDNVTTVRDEKMAQTLAPKGRSMVSSLMMGLTYGLGGVASPIVGKLADIYSIESVLFYIAFIPVISIFLIAKFPDVRASG